MRKIMAFLYIAAICLSLVCIDITYADDQFDVLILVDYDIKDDIQAKLNQYMTDLNNEGWSYIQRNATENEMSENHTYFRELLQNYSSDNSIKGAILIGDFPYATFKYFTSVYPCDYYYMDLDGTWNDTNNDDNYDEHTNGTGDIAPEIWIGRIIASTIDGSETQLINDYFQKNHDYRANTSSPTWPQRALAYADQGFSPLGPTGDYSSNMSDTYFEIVENMTTCLEKVYGEVTTVYATFPGDESTTANDYKNRLNATVGNEWVWLLAHGSLVNISGGHSDFSKWLWTEHTGWDGEPEGSVNQDFYLDHSPEAYFYIWVSCNTGNYSHQNSPANSAIFGDGWGLVSIAPTAGIGYSSNSFFEFFDKLSQGECIGEAFKTLWNRCYDPHWDLSYDQGRRWCILGDPTLCVSSAQETGTRYLQNAKWDSTYWKMLLYNTTTYTSKSKTMFGEKPGAYLGIKVYNGTTCISGASVIQVGYWNEYSNEVQGTTWNCSEHNVTDTYIKIEIWYKFYGYSWTSMGVAFKTETFAHERAQNTVLNATTWAIYFYGYFYQWEPLGPPGVRSTIRLFWGSSSKNSRIENMTFNSE